MSAPIIDFMERLKKRAGPAAFMCCPNCAGDSFGAVIRWQGPKPYIAALVCESCETEIGIQDGTPVGWRSPDA